MEEKPNKVRPEESMQAALDHYEKLSNIALEWNSDIPKAIKTYYALQEYEDKSLLAPIKLPCGKILTPELYTKVYLNIGSNKTLNSEYSSINWEEIFSLMDGYAFLRELQLDRSIEEYKGDCHQIMHPANMHRFGCCDLCGEGVEDNIKDQTDK